MVRWRRGCWCGRRRWLCPAGRAVGAGVVWMRFWAPGSPPQAFCLARFDARRAWGPAVCRRDGVAVRGGLRTG